MLFVNQIFEVFLHSIAVVLYKLCLVSQRRDGLPSVEIDWLRVLKLSHEFFLDREIQGVLFIQVAHGARGLFGLSSAFCLLGRFLAIRTSSDFILGLLS